MDILQIKLRAMSDIDEIFPSYIYKSGNYGPLDRVDDKMHGRAQISRYEILNLFVIIKYTLGSRNIILDYTRVTHSMHYVRYRYKGKMIIVHMIIYHRKITSNHMTLSSLGYH